MNNIFILIGPTASGKSDLAMKLISKFPFEIINADLYSAYKGLNIGTAKPTAEELAKYSHHMVNITSITNPLNASDYYISCAVSSKANIICVNDNDKRSCFVPTRRHNRVS